MSRCESGCACCTFINHRVSIDYTTVGTTEYWSHSVLCPECQLYKHDTPFFFKLNSTSDGQATETLTSEPHPYLSHDSSNITEQFLCGSAIIDSRFYAFGGFVHWIPQHDNSKRWALQHAIFIHAGGGCTHKRSNKTIAQQDHENKISSLISTPKFICFLK